MKIFVAAIVLTFITTVCGQSTREYRNLIGLRNMISPNNQAVVLISGSPLVIDNRTSHFVKIGNLSPFAQFK